MKNTVKRLGFIALITLIGFAACDNGNDPDPGNTTPKPTPTLSGRTSYINGGDQVVFSDLTVTYTLNGQKRDGNGDFVYDENNKYTWQPKAEGAYIWNDSTQTVTLTLEQVADDDGVMTAKASAMPLFVDWIGGEIDIWVEDRLKWSANAPFNETRTDAEDAVLATRNEENGTAYTTLNELINALAAIRFDETFASRSYTHTFSNNGVSLILLEALPPPVGTNELAGKTCHGTIRDWLTEVSEPDPDQEFVFTAAGTYTETSPDEEGESTTTSAGFYSYDSTAKRVYLKPAAKKGITPEQYYDTTDYYETMDRLPEADSRVSQTYQHFRVIEYGCDPSTNTVNTNRGGGNLEPL